MKVDRSYEGAKLNGIRRTLHVALLFFRISREPPDPPDLLAVHVRGRLCIPCCTPP